MSHVRRPYRYRLVDVFTTEPFEGNPLAVFTDAHGLDDRAMQLIARELNLSETTFCFPATRPDCVAQVRIFTPTKELPFAGHPTIGTSFVLLDESLVPRHTSHFALEEKVGPVPIRVESGERPLIWLRTPPIKYGPTRDRATCAAALGLGVDDLLDIAPQFVSAGLQMLFIPLKDPGAVDRAHPERLAALKGDMVDPFGVFPFASTPTGAYARMFAPDFGMPEDAGTGSATGPLASFMTRHGLLTGSRMTSEQGTKMGRRSMLHVVIDGDAIDVGGSVASVATGQFTL
jgi:trans-2,3-dihydro-3-hydroxyanthranilate isomerase